MEGTGETLRDSITVSDIFEIHRLQITNFGGESVASEEKELRSPGSLPYLVDLIQGKIFPYDQYPTIIEKAAILGWRIIQGHPFLDGNKRTGMAACFTLLKLNGYDVTVDDRSTEEMALLIANKAIQFEEFSSWLEKRLAKSKR
ncbi:MAG: Fic family protein [Candidatus Glassbacteria bacterium]